MTIPNIPEAALAWVAGRDTGTSSKTMWAALTGAVKGPARLDFYRDIPHDGDDFGRCYRLIQAVPEWASRLDEIVAAFPAWGPIIREWDRLCRIYDETGGRLYYELQPLVDESRGIDGWKQTSPHSWERRDE